MSRTRTAKERNQKKALKKATLKERKNVKRIDVTQLVTMLDETMKLNQHLLKAGSEREKAISIVLGEHEKRIEALEKELGIEHVQSKESSDQRRGSSLESAGVDGNASGRRMHLPELQPSGEGLSEILPLGDGAVPDQVGEEVPATSEVVFDEGASSVNDEV